MTSNKNPALLSPASDFLLTGGGSLLVFAALLLFVPRDESALHVVGRVASALLFLINYPHFAHSYQLLYGRYRKRLRAPECSAGQRLRLHAAGVAVPGLIVVWFVFCLGSGGQRWLGYTLNTMFLLAAWHFAKQGYGVLVVLSARKGVYLSRAEVRIFKLNVHLAWVFAWLLTNRAVAEESRYGVVYSTFACPGWLLWLSGSICALTTLLVLAMLLGRVRKRQPSLSWNGQLAYFGTLYVWLILCDSHPAFLLLVPLFHSLQYLPFVWRYRLGELLQESEAGRVVLFRFVRFELVGLVLGMLLFAGFPALLDLAVDYDRTRLGPALPFFLFATLVNIHHYFIDNVIWRAEIPGVQRLSSYPV